MKRICAVIPAAGRGSRLGLDCPKLLVPIDKQRTIWNILKDNLLPVVDHIHVVVAPDVMPQFSQLLQSDKERARLSASVQARPLGMGDAIFGALDYWSAFPSLLIIWGDQVNASASTLKQVALASAPEKTIILPLVQCQNPYVQYDLNDGVLTGVRQSREGDLMDPVGLSDVGIFALSVSELPILWKQFTEKSASGAQTGEVNFLPFLSFLSRDYHWTIETVPVSDPVEARGVNTIEDLEFARERFSH